MHFQRDYEYPLYKRATADEMQVLPKNVFKTRQNLFLPQKTTQSDNEAKRNQVGPNEYYYQKELHGWEKNCSCGILTSEYQNPIEFQPVILRNLNSRLPYMNPHSSQNNVHSGLSYSRTCTDDFPLWLKIYSRASVECDHKLQWDMFNIRDLYFFDNVLVKLYELDLEEIILWYKSYKNALLREMDKRLLKANQQRQMILLYNS